MKNMKLTTYTSYNTINLIPCIDLTYEKFYEGGFCHLRLDIGWLKWGISIIFVDK